YILAMALIVMPSLLSKSPWARIRARCEASFFIVLSKRARCCSVRGRTYLTIIDLDIGFTYRIVWMFYRPRSRRRPLAATQHNPTTSLVGQALDCNETGRFVSSILTIIVATTH